MYKTLSQVCTKSVGKNIKKHKVHGIIIKPSGYLNIDFFVDSYSVVL